MIPFKGYPDETMKGFVNRKISENPRTSENLSVFLRTASDPKSFEAAHCEGYEVIVGHFSDLIAKTKSQ